MSRYFRRPFIVNTLSLLARNRNQRAVVQCYAGEKRGRERRVSQFCAAKRDCYRTLPAHNRRKTGPPASFGLRRVNARTLDGRGLNQDCLNVKCFRQEVLHGRQALPIDSPRFARGRSGCTLLPDKRFRQRTAGAKNAKAWRAGTPKRWNISSISAARPKMMHGG